MVAIMGPFLRMKNLFKVTRCQIQGAGGSGFLLFFCYFPLFISFLDEFSFIFWMRLVYLYFGPKPK